MMLFPAEKLTYRRQVNPEKKDKKIMGDKSPKSNQKKSTQKTSKATTVAIQKKQAVAAKATPKKK